MPFIFLSAYPKEVGKEVDSHASVHISVSQYRRIVRLSDSQPPKILLRNTHFFQRCSNVLRELPEDFAIPALVEYIVSSRNVVGEIFFPDGLGIEIKKTPTRASVPFIRHKISIRCAAT